MYKCCIICKKIELDLKTCSSILFCIFRSCGRLTKLMMMNSSSNPLVVEVRTSDTSIQSSGCKMQTSITRFDRVSFNSYFTIAELCNIRVMCWWVSSWLKKRKVVVIAILVIVSEAVVDIHVFNLCSYECRSCIIFFLQTG